MSYYRFAASPRLREAIASLGKDKLAEGLSLLEDNPELLKAEDIGEDEERINISMSQVPEIDNMRINKLVRHLGVDSRSMVVRSAIEALIDKYELTQFKKPGGWKSRPLTLKHAGSRGKNPMPKSPKPLVATTVNLPLSVYEKLESFNSAKLVPIDRLARYTLSDFVRDAIDRMNEPLAPVPPELLEEKTRQIRISIYKEQYLRLRSLLRQLDFPRLKHLLIAIILQEQNRIEKRKY